MQRHQMDRHIRRELYELGAESWYDRAICAQTDPESFFPDQGGSNREAKRICGTCLVRAECLEYALTHNQQYGIWGGMTLRERLDHNARVRAQAAVVTGAS
ncbi:WhiB family transcriptional regulator [Nocardia jejuensis]|uniref:WhiB family transcriptional regulator n=1 Tax=Nocardia jejuensis TaxID=328049 RepID=UPI0008324053|nr:WhiB family transcriptional regulator [Nocardia jejuensis]